MGKLTILSLIECLQSDYDLKIASEVLAGLRLRCAWITSLNHFVYIASVN